MVFSSGTARISGLAAAIGFEKREGAAGAGGGAFIFILVHTTSERCCGGGGGRKARSRSTMLSSRICTPAAKASPAARFKTKKNRPGGCLRRFSLKFWLRGQDLNL